MRFTGKTALVTGGSRGIGRAVAERLASEGATVALTHLHDEREAGEAVAAIEASGGRSLAIHADAASAADCDRAVAQTLAAFGDLHVLIVNAGIQAPTPGEDFDDATLERIIAVNLTGAARICRAALRHFESRPGGGSIVVTTSVHQLIPKPGYLAYSLAKTGLSGLVRTLALEFAARGVRVNAVGPGAIVTAMNEAWIDDPKKRSDVEAHIPMGRAGTAQEMAGVFAFLASDEASYVTGQTLYACGGLTLFGDFAKNWAS